ncbi:MAG: aquaporin [Ferruginibacter sp.]
MKIHIENDKEGLAHIWASFKQNWNLYLMEAFGLAIFMVSACFFGGMLEAKTAIFHNAIPDDFIRRVLMGVLMGSTALFIFYSPVTAPSGAHINPAVTITFFRLGKISKADSFFYIIFQFIGGTVAVYIMQKLMGDTLTGPPVNSVVTVPGKYGDIYAALAEFCIAFVMITMVLFTSAQQQLKKYTRIIAGCLVCIYVITTGPVSGFGMNPARSFASALPANIYTSFWIYMIIPFAGMLTAAECFVLIRSLREKNSSTIVHKNIYTKNTGNEKLFKDLNY